jgi:sugar/nucleoside kinase (ribokinase family)
MEPKGRVLVVGNAVLDLVVAPLLKPPPQGRTIKVDLSKLFVGGCGVNTALVLARLGEVTSLVGPIGDDTLGSLLISRLKEVGVDCGGLIVCEGVDTSVTVVLVWEKGERSFLHSGGNSGRLNGGHLDGLDTSGVDHIHIGGALLLTGVEAEDWARTLKRFKQAGATTSLDPAWDARGLWLEVLEPALPHIDYLFPNKAEAEMLTGESDPGKAGKSLVNKGVAKAVVKLGEEGSLLVKRGDLLHQRAFEVEVVDTTGAGDAYDAGFIAALRQEKTDEEAMRWGAAAGTLAISDYGATSSLHSREQLFSLLSRV